MTDMVPRTVPHICINNALMCNLIFNHSDYHD